MQSSASQLEADREKRLALLAEQEKAQAEIEEAARVKASRVGGRGEFLTSVSRKAGDLDLGDRMKRGKGARTFVAAGGEE